MTFFKSFLILFVPGYREFEILHFVAKYVWYSLGYAFTLAGFFIKFRHIFKAMRSFFFKILKLLHQTFQKSRVLLLLFFGFFRTLQAHIFFMRETVYFQIISFTVYFYTVWALTFYEPHILSYIGRKPFFVIITTFSGYTRIVLLKKQKKHINHTFLNKLIWFIHRFIAWFIHRYGAGFLAHSFFYVFPLRGWR